MLSSGKTTGDGPPDLAFGLHPFQVPTMNKWKFFIGASILVAGLLIKLGAPLEAIAAGLFLAGLSVWKIEQHARRPSR